MSRMILLCSSGSSTRAAAAAATRSTAGRSVVVDGVAVTRRRRPAPIRLRHIARALGDGDDDGAEYEFSGDGLDPMEAAG